MARDEAQHYLASIIDSSDDAIFGTSDGIIITWNRGAETLYGYRADEIIGKSVSILAPPDRRHEARENLERCKRGERIRHFETVRVRKDGTLLDLSLTISLIRNAAREVVGAATIARDISERKRAEEAIRESEEKYRLLVANIPDVVWTADDEGHCVFSTPNIEEMYGYTPTEIYQSGVWFDRVHPEDAEKVREAYTKLLNAGQMFSMEHRIQKKNGSWIWILAKAMASYEKSGKRFTVGISSDITARKQGEEELTRAKEAAEAANRAKSEFLANMSHEIRTPMNAIFGMTDLVLDTELTQQQREDLNIVKSSADSLLGIINDILDFSKIEAGKLTLENIAFDLRANIQSAIQALAVRAAQKNLKLTCDIAPDVPLQVWGDPGRVRQILLNIVGNAIKFTEQGDVAVEIKQLSEIAGQAFLQIQVRDTGVGIPPEQQKSIFEAFVQGDTSVTRRFGGTGLGLAITSRLVALMGGEIRLESEVGIGSTFHIFVRLGVARPMEDATASELAPVRGKAVSAPWRRFTRMLPHLTAFGLGARVGS